MKAVTERLHFVLHDIIFMQITKCIPDDDGDACVSAPCIFSIFSSQCYKFAK